MNQRRQDNDRLAYCVGSVSLSGLTMTKIILWLLAITIVSFTIGFAILALSGNLSPGSAQKAGPFRNTVLGTPNTTSFPIDGASSGEIRILLGAGDLSVEGGAPAARLMEATVSSGRPEMQPDYSETVNNSVRIISMTETGHKKKDWVVANMPESWKNSWNVKMGSGIPVSLTVNLGAGDCTIAPGNTNLTALTVNNGAGDTMIDLSGSRGGPSDTQIHHGVGDLTLRINRESNTRIRIRHGVGDIETRGLVQTDEHYETAGFNPSRPVNEITVSQGVGSILLEAV